MNFLHLLQQRDALLRNARLANLAFAYDRLGDLAARLTRAQVRGELALRTADPAGDRIWPALVAHEGNQSVIEEHFTEEEIAELADIFAYLHEDKSLTEFTFRPDDLESRFLAVLRRELEAGGVSPGEGGTPSPEDSKRERG